MTLAAAAAGTGVVLGIHTARARVFGKRDWAAELNDSNVLLTLAIGVGLGAGIERAAPGRRWWEYHERVPMLPG